MVGAVTRPTPPRPPGASRRAVLRLGATAPLVMALAACSGPVVEQLEAPRSTPPVPPNPDQPVVDSVIEAMSVLVSRLRPLGPRDPALADLVALHDAHLARLGPPSEPVTIAPVSVRFSPAQVRAREEALRDQLADHAAEVQNGELARLLASMSAAVTQRLAGTGA